MESPLLEFRSVSKSFGSLRANHEISFSVRTGRIHALIGENGAGKSTLMKILFGLQAQDSGEIFLRGKAVRFRSSIDAKSAGLGMVHQHFMLAGTISALDHIVLDQKTKGSSWAAIPRRKIRETVDAVAKKFNMPIPWDDKVEKLPIGLQQRLEILKLLVNEAEVLILDEPTAVLTPQEIEGFFAQLRQLRAAGKTIIIITHKLKEVLALADEFSVLRHGELVHSGEVKGQSTNSLGELMIGRKPRDLGQTLIVTTLNSLALQVEKLKYEEDGRTWIDGINLKVQAGEIVGLAGVEANGQSQLLDLLFRPAELLGKKSGRVLIEGTETLSLSNPQIRALGVNYFPEDRLSQALLLHANASENFLLGQQWRNEYVKKGWIQWGRLREKVKSMMQANDVRPLDLDLELARFSGGNQQKFVVGRELSQNPKLLIAAQPTRGVDIGAIESIHSEILKQKFSGAGVLLVSSELDEIMKLADRIYVIFQGRLVSEYLAAEFDEKRIGASMGGA